jgi:hypothetical protein
MQAPGLARERPASRLWSQAYLGIHGRLRAIRQETLLSALEVAITALEAERCTAYVLAWLREPLLHP